MRTRSGSRYSNGGEVVALVGQKRKRSPSAVAGECDCGGRRKRPAGEPDYLDALPDDLVLSILSKLAAASSAPSDLLSVHLTYVCLPARASFAFCHQLLVFPRTASAPSPSRYGVIEMRGGSDGSFCCFRKHKLEGEAKDRALTSFACAGARG
jgi:hypothetical protein